MRNFERRRSQSQMRSSVPPIRPLARVLALTLLMHQRPPDLGQASHTTEARPGWSVTGFFHHQSPPPRLHVHQPRPRPLSAAAAACRPIISPLFLCILIFLRTFVLFMGLRWWSVQKKPCQDRGGGCCGHSGGHSRSGGRCSVDIMIFEAAGAAAAAAAATAAAIPFNVISTDFIKVSAD